jgi:hypothetical protein
MTDGVCWWEELADLELLLRLTQRGIDEDEAARLVDARDGSWAARLRISELLT